MPTLRVLIVEDNPDDAELLQIELRRLGYDLSAARVETAQEMRQALGERPWDVVLSDFTMPAFSAGQALQTLKDSGLDLPFIVVSGTIGEDAAVAAMRDGVHDYLVKSNLTRLGPAIDRELREARNRHERRRSEAHARLWAALVASSGEAIKCETLDGTITSWNPAAERLFGWTADEAVGQNMSMLIPPDRREEVEQCQARLRAGSPVEHLETVRLHKDGTPIEVSVTMSPIRDEQGRLLGFSRIARDIRAQLQAERALRASEARFRALVESSFEIVSVVDADGIARYVSPACIRVGGWTPEQQVGRSVFEVCEPTQVAQHRAAFRELLTQPGAAVTWQGKIMHTDGSTRDVESTFTNLLEVPEVRGVVINSRDITEQKRAEVGMSHARGAAEQGLAQLRAVFASMTEGVIIADAAGNLLEWNEAALRLHGYDSVEEVRKPLEWFADRYEFVRPNKPPLPLSEWPLARVLRGETFLNLELTVRRRDTGLERVISYGGAPVFGADGKVELGTLALHDLTEYRRIQAERDRLLMQLQLQIERMPLAYVRLDEQDRIAEWNPAAERIFGFTKAEAVGVGPPFDPILNEACWVEFSHVLRRAHRGDTAARAVIDCHTKDGRAISCEWQHTPLIDAAGLPIGVLCLAQDVTERRQLENQLRQAQKMEAVGQLAGGVAHDFNNLLTIINGYSEILLQNMAPTDPARVLAEEIHGAGERSAALTRQLLVFSRKQVVNAKVLDLNEAVHSAEKLLRRIIGEDVRLVTAGKPLQGRVRADPGQLEQVLVNLAVNARDAMPTGGRLTIETSDTVIDEAHARLHVGIRPGPYVLLAVTDTGCGMPPEVKARIFEPFFTTKEVGKGTGLGLAVVHGIIQQAGGCIEVHSEVGKGTTFKVYLPRVDEPIRTAARSLLQPPPRGTETVLIVEDDSGVRALSRHVLRACGYTVLEAADGSEALRLAADQHGTIHLVVTDVVMPGMGGRQLADLLLAQRPGLKTLFVSGYTDDAVVRHGVQDGDVPFLQKPFSPRALAHKVREVLDMGRTSAADALRASW